MKRLLYILFLVLFTTFVAHSQESKVVTIKYSLAQLDGQTRSESTTDEPTLTRYIIEVYDAGSDFKDKILTESFTNIDDIRLSLLKDSKYDMLFWADCGGYNVESLQSVSWDNDSNVDERLAYAAQLYDVDLSESSLVDVTMKRSVARLNLINLSGGAAYSGGYTTIEYSVSLNYNVATDEVTESTQEAFSTTKSYLNSGSTTEPFATDYLFVPESGLIDFKFTVSNTDGTITNANSLESIPVAKNTISNISIKIN